MQKIQTFLVKGKGMNVFIGLKKISFLIGATQLRKTLKIW